MYEISLPHGTMTRFPAAGVKKNALILCPGGGYEHCSIREGAPAGRAFARRAHAEQYGISPQRIAVGGFSAGAHLAGLHAAVWNRASWYPQGTDLALHQPNAAVLCYPVVSAGEYAHRGSFEQLAGDDMEKQQAFSLENLVSPDMPRTFLWHTLTDETVPVENSLLLEKSLRRAGVSHELHLFPHGVHGLALADMETSDIEKGRLPDRHIARWQALCAEWLKE